MTLPPSPSSPQTRPQSHLALQTSPLAQLLLREPFPGVHSFTVLFLLQMDQPRWDHLQVSFPLVQSLPSSGLTCLLPPNPGSVVPRGRELSPHPTAFVPLGSLVSWPRSREAPGRMCVTSLQSLTQISLQAPLSPSSPKFYWARENEGRPQAQSPHQHCVPPSIPQPSLPLAWTQEPALSLRNRQWASAWDTALLPRPQPAKWTGP